jgi:hypothetical protein
LQIGQDTPRGRICASVQTARDKVRGDTIKAQ